MGIIKSKFRKMEEFDCSMDDMDGKIEETNFDPRSPNSDITRTPLVVSLFVPSPSYPYQCDPNASFHPQECRAKSSLISRAANLANISTPIHNDLLMIQDKRFKHLAHSFIDPRSPSDGIIRTPIVIKSSDISSIVNTPRILEEELDEHADNDEDFQKTFEEALSRMSFDDCLDDDQQVHPVLPDLIETHFEGEESDFPVLLQPKVTNLIKQSELDPRSPTIGINRTPLVFAGEQQEQRKIPAIPKETLKTFAEQLKAGEEDVTKESEGTKEISIEGGGKDIVNEQKPAIVIDEPEQKLTVKSSAPTDVGRVIYGTPVQITSNAPIQQVRTPLSCVANRKRGDLNVGKSPMSSTGAVSKKNLQKGQSHLAKDNGMDANVKPKKAAANPFETAPRKLIR